MGQSMEPAMVQGNFYCGQNFQIIHDYLECPNNADRDYTETMAEKRRSGR